MKDLDRRSALSALAATTAAVGGCKSGGSKDAPNPQVKEREMTQDPTYQAEQVSAPFALQKGTPWPTPDPFLFCVHHNDSYPKGNGKFGPKASLDGRRIGMDFEWKDGWNMYHGDRVPGFPAHPHRGFETVTVVRSGRLDHADSLGAAARYGDGDVQWLTAGAGIQHAEMFPLLSTEQDNPLDLFQIWLNLPKKSKMVQPYFSMLWAHEIPEKLIEDVHGKKTKFSIRAGEFFGTRAPTPPPDSWASDPKNEVGIVTAEMDPGAKVLLPPVDTSVNRVLYFFSGESLKVGERMVRPLHGVELRAEAELEIENGPSRGEFLILQGRPIGEPVARQGPFVMNTQEELRQAYLDYQRTRFGGWPWESSDPVHGADPTRFARTANGDLERPRSPG